MCITRVLQGGAKHICHSGSTIVLVCTIYLKCGDVFTSDIITNLLPSLMAKDLENQHMAKCSGTS